MKCRICQKKINEIFCDLGNTPLANSYLTNNSKFKSEKYHPLKVYFCRNCYLPQLPEHRKSKSIFTKYDYFSSYSTTWLRHSKEYVKKITFFLKLKKNSKVCEIASNDGYLLQFFNKKKINVLGIEPAKNVASHSIAKGIPTISKFFNYKLSKSIKKNYGTQDLIICNNVLAHVPNILTFVRGIKNILSKDGTATIEFPHFLNLIKYNQFDTIYHEHFSYLSLMAIQKLFQKFEMDIYNVEKLSTHGGSLRVYIKYVANKNKRMSKNVEKVLAEEINFKLFSRKTFKRFNQDISNIKKKINILIKDLNNKKKSIVAYGAAAKGNTFLNYCKINDYFIKLVADKNPSKINKYLPGSHIKICSVATLIKKKPDYVIILPWNLKKEIISSLKSFIKCKYIICIPKIKII
ncbi:MAG: SAM-dependent methyltransferase [Flavobacteriaceae bacterium]|nr:SAM-dependent methyltransferase [Flavobacteriaceae bacterium]|tara:strand:+ start:2903 stop:4120 length:1218 start_codon:yes stop_codon:yes gene_type:complete